MANFRTLKQFLEMESDVIPAQPNIQQDVAQDLAKKLFTAAEEHVANTAAGQGGQGFSGDAIRVEAGKILKRVDMFLDDLIKRG